MTDKEKFVLQQEGSQLFGGTDTPYMAFLAKDAYYPDCARKLAQGVYARRRTKDGHAIDLGAGCGGSGRVFIDFHDKLTCVEPEEGLRRWLSFMFPENPRVRIVDGRAENLAEVVQGPADVVYLCNVMPHLIGREDGPIQQISQALTPSGFCAFDLGPSNYTYEQLRLANFRDPSGAKPGEIATELGHPIQHLFYEHLRPIVEEKLAHLDLGKDSWPPEKGRFTREGLTTAFGDHGMDLAITEELMPIAGTRIKNFIALGGRLVHFRKEPYNTVPVNVRDPIIEQALARTFEDPRFKTLEEISAYHPMAIGIAQKRPVNHKKVIL